MIEKQSFIFFKFGSEKDITDLFENGTIFFNTIDYFQRLESQGVRGDKYEGTTKITNHKSDKLKLTITIPETEKKIPFKLSKFHLRESETFRLPKVPRDGTFRKLRVQLLSLLRPLCRQF